jgi:hypothetical protein
MAGSNLKAKYQTEQTSSADSQGPVSEQGWAIGVVVACNGDLKSSPSAPYLPPETFMLEEGKRL